MNDVTNDLIATAAPAAEAHVMFAVVRGKVRTEIVASAGPAAEGMEGHEVVVPD